MDVFDFVLEAILMVGCPLGYLFLSKIMFEINATDKYNIACRNGESLENANASFLGDVFLSENEEKRFSVCSDGRSAKSEN